MSTREPQTKLIIISGRSGSGKSTALHVLEDLGFYCVDNLPIGLLPTLVKQINQDASARIRYLAVGVDARNLPSQLAHFPQLLEEVAAQACAREVIFLDADEPILLNRFSETRRKHPLSSEDISLAEAIRQERELLDPIASLADLTVDTSELGLHDLRDLIKQRVGHDSRGMALLFESFAYKRGVPADTDLVFDARCLPNPYWKTHLRPQTGRDQSVIDFLEAQPSVSELFEDLCQFLNRWLPYYEANNRSYMTVGVGCTGGQHRSVYLTEKLAAAFRTTLFNVQVRHRELSA